MKTKNESKNFALLRNVLTTECNAKCTLQLSEWFNKMFGREGSEKPPSDLGDVVEGVPSHSHCLRCGKAITSGRAFCSEICKQGQRKKGPSFIWIILLMMLMLLFLFNH